ncbi:MAG TPA: hypothetical protein VMU92_13270 [Acidobacteriaceae bacterium]|nr:hypothetical protein [Acidobacteriaceae bacterium]
MERVGKKLGSAVGSAVAWSVGMVAGVVVDGVPELWVEILDFAGVVGSSEFEK